MRARICAGILLTLCFGLRAVAQTWQRMGPEGGLVVSLAASAGGTVYLGTADGHVFVRERGAIVWELRGRVGPRMDGVVTRILPDPQEESVAYAAVWYQDPNAGGGVFRTEDAGKNWKRIGLAGEAVRALEMAPSQPDEFIAGTRTGVFRSQDRGRNWVGISPAGDEELRNLDSVAVDPKDANIIYAGTYHLPWKTTDGGKTWKPVIAGLIDDSDIMSLRVDATDPARVYLSACSGIYRSENRGEQWLKLQGIPYSARRTQAIVQDPAAPKTLYAATTEGLWITRDGGESWERTTPREWVVNGVVVVSDPSNNRSQVIIGTEVQGVLVSEDQGKQFSAQNEGFTHRVATEIVGAWSDPRRLLMILQRNGQEILESRDAGNHWDTVSLAAAGKNSATLSAENVARVYATARGWMLRSRSGQLWLQEQGKETWMEWKLEIPASRGKLPRSPKTKRVTAIAKKLKALQGPWMFDEKRIYVGTEEGLAGCEWQGSCSLLRAFGQGAGVRTVFAESAGATVFAVVGTKLGRSEDGGQTAVWSDLPSSVQQAKWISAAMGTSTKTILLGTDHGLYSSTDEGKNWRMGAGGVPAGNIGEYSQSGDLIVVTLTDGGMYISEDQGMNWRRIERDTERGVFSGLVEVQPGVVMAGSQSEGLLRVEVKGRR